MSLERHFDSGKFELLKREVKSSTSIPLKTMLHWLINSKDHLKEQQDKGNKRGSVIVITVSNKIEGKRLTANDLQFEGAIKKVEKY